MTSSHCFVLVYAINSRDSFWELENCFDQISRWRDRDVQDIATVVVANKSDLEGEREVRTEEGKMLAEKYKSEFIESSAKTNENIQEIFKRVCVECWIKLDGHTYLKDKEFKKDKFGIYPRELKRRIFLLFVVLHRNEKEISLKVPKPLVELILKLIFQEEMKQFF